MSKFKTDDRVRHIKTSEEGVVIETSAPGAADCVVVRWDGRVDGMYQPVAFIEKMTSTRMQRDMYHWERVGEREYAAGNGSRVWRSSDRVPWQAYAGRRKVGEDFDWHVACGLAEVEPEPINAEVDANLRNIGYSYQHYPADFDDGDAENGPGRGGHDEYDEYTSDDDYVIIDAHGHFAHHELRDKELEKWLDDDADEAARAGALEFKL